ncbi:putative conserved membrane protein [Synechococcus sp. RS9909]|nr:putative conserved membrane protein [Synechococcus sp. RS9909]
MFNPLFVLAPFEGLAIPNPILPVLGVVFLPTTTLGVCFAHASFGGVGSFSGLLVVAIGLVIDAGLIGNGRGLAKR